MHRGAARDARRGGRGRRDRSARRGAAFAGVGQHRRRRSLATAARRSLVSHNGTVGHTTRRIQEFELPLPARRAPGHALRRARSPLAARRLPGPAAARPDRDRRGAVPRLRARPRRRDGRRRPRMAARMTQPILTTVAIAPSTTSCSRASARARSPACSASTGRSRRGSPPPCRRSPATRFEYAGGGKVEFRVDGVTAPAAARDPGQRRGPGIANLDDVLDGRYASPTGMGLGIVGARRLMDRFDDRVAPGRGTTVALAQAAARGRRLGRRALPRSPSRSALAARRRPDSASCSRRTRSCSARSRSCTRARRSWRGSTASSRRPTAAWSRCTPSSTSGPRSCGGERGRSRASSRASATSSARR